MRTKLIQILRWLLVKLEAQPALEQRARELTQAAERLVASGEFKRHQVYAQLLKEFPEEPKRRVGLVIEQVLQ